MSESPPILCLRSHEGLQGASPFDADALERFPFGSEIEIRPKQTRSDARRRYYFAMLNAALPNVPDHFALPSADALHEWIKVRLGYRKEVVLPAKSLVWIDGPKGPELITLHDETVAYTAGSIGKSMMDEATFSELLNRALDLIQAELIPGIDISLLKREVKKSLGRTFEKVPA